MKTRCVSVTVFSLLAVFAAQPAQAETFQFHIVGIECQQCVDPIRRALLSTSGIDKAQVDWKKETAEIEFQPGFDKSRIKAALENLGFAVVFPGESKKGFEPLPESELAKLDVQRFNGRSSIEEKAVSVPGKTTLIDYYADWCGPCKTLELRLQHYMLLHPEIALRRVDIGKWDNAAARQITKQGAASLPYVRVYSAGKLIGNGGMWDEILALIEKSQASS